MPHNVILQSDWFAKIPGILHNVVNTILPDPFHEGGVWVVRLDTTPISFTLAHLCMSFTLGHLRMTFSLVTGHCSHTTSVFYTTKVVPIEEIVQDYPSKSILQLEHWQHPQQKVCVWVGG